MSRTRHAPVAVLTERVRVEEKQIFAALERRGVDFCQVDSRQLAFHLSGDPPRYGVVLNRAVAQTRALYATHCFEALGIPVVNSGQVATVCGDKLLTSLAFERGGIPTPRTALALTPATALTAIEHIGYPVVLKPVTGSWGRLLARINDRDAAEALLEHRETLGSSREGIFYIQQYVRKPGRDIRTIVIGDEVVSAIYRQSEHWITNTARGAQPLACPISAELVQLSLSAARAVGGGALAVDLLEDSDGTLLVNEVNHTPEFHGSVAATGADIAGRLVDYTLARARGAP